MFQESRRENGMGREEGRRSVSALYIYHELLRTNPFCDANFNLPETASFQNSIFSPLKTPPPGKCRRGRMPPPSPSRPAATAISLSLLYHKLQQVLNTAVCESLIADSRCDDTHPSKEGQLQLLRPSFLITDLLIYLLSE